MLDTGDSPMVSDITGLIDPVEIVIRKYDQHPSILAIEWITSSGNQRMNSVSKTGTHGNIPPIHFKKLWISVPRHFLIYGTKSLRKTVPFQVN